MSIRSLVLALCLVSVAPAVAHAQSGLSSGRRIAAVAGGVGLLALGYGLNVLVGELAGECVGIGFATLGGGGCAASPGWEGFRNASLAPLIGPWMQLGLRPSGSGPDCWPGFLVVDGLLQLAAVALIAVFASLPDGSSPSVYVAPLADAHGGGVAVGGAL